jgi:amino acid adenylation domain-containing protein
MKNPEQLSELKRRLLERVLRGEVARATWEAPIQSRPPGAKVPIAPSQQQVWLHSQMGDTRFVYNEPITIHYHGRLDEGAFERSFHEFLRRHEIWRTTFASADGQVVQVVHPQLEIEIPLADLTGLPGEDRDAEATRIATADAQRPFDLAVGPLLRGRLFKLREDRYRFHLTLHHIIFDGVSIYRTVLPELAAIYNAFAKGEPSPLPEPILQYGDYALWQARLQESASVGEQLTYWRQQLAGELPTLHLPTDRPRPPMPSYRGGMETFALSPALTAEIKRRSKDERVTPYMFLLAAFKALLHRYSGQEDILIGGVTDGRRRPEFHNLVGFFLQTVVLRTRPSSRISFSEYLGQVKDAVLGGIANSDVPFDHLVRELQPKRDSSRHPFFQVLFSMEPPATPVDAPWELTQMDIATGASKVDLHLEIDEHKDRFIARFIYSTDVFEAPTIRRMVGHWLTLLEAAVAHPETLLRDLQLLTADESRWLRTASAGPQREIPPATVHGLIEAQCDRTPSRVAIEYEGQQVTYRELNDAATRLARRLVEAGVESQTLVGLCVERSANMVIALLAILKAGGAYIPIEPTLPRQRIAVMMEDAKPLVVLTEKALAAHLPHTDARVVCIDDSADNSLVSGAGDRASGSEKCLRRARPPAPREVRPEDLAHVLYTSGSTGRPKGVEVSHGALVNLLLSMQHEPGFAAGEKLLAVATISFDIAGLELYLPLISGGSVVIATREDARDPARLVERMRETQSTVMQATPATWRGLIESGWPGDPALKILCGGEALTHDLAQQLLARSRELWNMYGPTETTIYSTIQRIPAQASVIPIGRPISNTDVFVLDANLNPLPVGVSGELYIGGAGLARGYLRRAELTRERFIASPFDPAGRLYRTGDVARWLPDGTIEYLGRADNQVKIRGFRIELEEVETAIVELPGVTAAAVKARPDGSGSLALSAYICGAPTLDLRRALQHKLPEYMIPSRTVFLDALPLTPSGKLDRNALPDPAMDTTSAYVAPASTIERRLARIFESVLGLPTVGVRENFFNLGGHSLLVAKLLRGIELEFGRRLTMRAIFQSPTIEHLAYLLDGQSCLAARPRTVDIRPAGVSAPFFWIYGGPLFLSLESRVDPAHPLVTVALDPSEERTIDSSAALPTLAQIVEPLVRRIRMVQPEGPYHLGGWCSAGVMAYEVARQLEDAGHRVSLLALVDAPNPAHLRAIPGWRMNLSKLRYRLAHTARLRGRGARDYAAERLRNLSFRLFVRKPVGRLTFEDKMNLAADNYAPKPLDGRVALIRPSDRPQVPDLKCGWEQVLGNRLEVYDVGGDHISMFLESNVESLAVCLNRCLDDNPSRREIDVARRRAG